SCYRAEFNVNAKLPLTGCPSADAVAHATVYLPTGAGACSRNTTGASAFASSRRGALTAMTVPFAWLRRTRVELSGTFSLNHRANESGAVVITVSLAGVLLTNLVC